MGFLFDSQTMRSELEQKKTEAEAHDMAVDFMLDIIKQTLYNNNC